jgi:uncharacterized protein (DUF2235 family)
MIRTVLVEAWAPQHRAVASDALASVTDHELAVLSARWPRAIPHLAAHPGSVASAPC